MKKIFRKFNNKNFIIPFVIITLVFFSIGYIAINEFRNNYYEYKKEEALKLARNYSYNLSKSAEATEIINQLLEEKMYTASKMTVNYGNEYNNQVLAELAEILSIDKIYYYNPRGEIIYSNDGEYIAWKADEGHPVYDFMKSDQQSFVGEIRKDSESDVYYKYGYFKADDGSFVQIGIYADRIYNFLGSFEMQQLLEELVSEGNTEQVCFINNDFSFLGSTKKEAIGKKIRNKNVISSIMTGKEYGYLKTVGGEKLYEVFVPVMFGKEKIGALAIKYSLKETEEVIRNITIIILLSISGIYVSLLYTLMTQYKKNKELVRLAYYDSLTGLPNKQYLEDLLDEGIKKKNLPKALFLINTSNFRSINMIYGYDYGDQILKELANRLNSQLKGKSNQHLFRFTADKFVIYVENYIQKKELINLAQEINTLFSRYFEVNAYKHYLLGQIGIVEIDRKYENVDRILKDASIALNYISKKDSFNYSFFNKEMELKLSRDKLIEEELRLAIDEEDISKLYLEYQPQVDLKKEKIVGFEALARMKIDGLGQVSPLEFIDIAERNGLIISLGEFIFRQACQFLNTLNKMGITNMSIAVNVSGIQLLRRDFTKTVLAIIEETNIDESNIELELTESILFRDFNIINKRLKELKEHNIKIAIDDFGTGYSSLYRLTELKLDILKIDRYFINKISLNRPEQLLTGDIISIAHKFGLTVIAEGVENQQEKDYLIANNCDIMQGYLFSKPLSEIDAIALLKDTGNN